METAREGSFCRWRKGSPPGYLVPETMLTFSPGVCACAVMEVKTAATRNAWARNARSMRMSISPRRTLSFAGTEFSEPKILGTELKKRRTLKAMLAVSSPRLR